MGSRGLDETGGPSVVKVSPKPFCLSSSCQISPRPWGGGVRRRAAATALVIVVSRGLSPLMRLEEPLVPSRLFPRVFLSA
jgi:hypothetical protein